MQRALCLNSFGGVAAVVVCLNWNPILGFVSEGFVVVVFFNFIYLFIYFLAALGLHCCVRPFSSCGKWGLLFVAACRLLIAVASLVAEHGL